MAGQPCSRPRRRHPPTTRPGWRSPGRPAASDALIPGLDQTRTVGLVTLPGAYVGMLLGGASPVEAGAVQLFVPVALMAVQAVAVAVVLELMARGRVYRLHSEPSEGE